MRAIYFFSIFLLCTVAVQASNAKLFQLDEQQIQEEFSGLNELEAFVNSHEGITVSQLNLQPELKNQLNTSALETFAALNGEPPLGIPSFCWGCCFGWVAGTVFWAAVYVVYVLFFLSYYPIY